MRAFADARDAIDQANMEASAAREGLSSLAEALRSDPNLELAVQALDQGRIGDAMTLLRKRKADSGAGAIKAERKEGGCKAASTKNSKDPAPDDREPELNGKKDKAKHDALSPGNRAVNMCKGRR